MCPVVDPKRSCSWRLSANSTHGRVPLEGSSGWHNSIATLNLGGRIYRSWTGAELKDKKIQWLKTKNGPLGVGGCIGISSGNVIRLYSKDWTA